MRRPSSSSAGAIYADRPALIEELHLAEQARRRDSSIEEVVLFGSLARGDSTARSDVDLLVVLTQSAHPRRMDRIPELSKLFDTLSSPTDIVPVTRGERADAIRDGNRFFLGMLETGVRLA